MFRKITAVFILGAALSLSGCAASNTEIRIATPQIPQSLMHCIPAPYRDKPFVRITQRQAAVLLARYKSAHADCYSKVSRLRAIYTKWKAETDGVN